MVKRMRHGPFAAIEAGKGFPLKHEDRRAMKVHEYQAKELLKRPGSPFRKGSW